MSEYRRAFFIKETEPNTDANLGGWKGFATKPVVDRVGDIVNPMGLQNLDEYMKNPVVFFNHNVNQPIGRVTRLEARADGLWDEGRFGRTEFAQDRRRDLEDGIINMQSIGFQPIDSRPIRDANDARALMKQHGMEYDALDEKAQLRIATEGEYIDTWDLYEISLVGIPANPAAQIAFAKSLGNAYKGKPDSQPVDFLPALQEFIRRLQYEGKPSAPFADLPIAAEGTRWNPRGERDSAINEAILGGDPDAPRWSRFREAHFWFDNTNSNLPETQSAYKLKFARMFTANDPENINPDAGQLTAIWQQVASRMAILLGARGGVDMPDEQRRSTYNHIVKYYKMWDKEPPEFSRSFDDVRFASGELEILNDTLRELDPKSVEDLAEFLPMLNVERQEMSEQLTRYEDEIDSLKAEAVSVEGQAEAVKAGRILSAKNRKLLLEALETTGDARRAMVAAERGLKEVLSLSEPPDKSAGDGDNATDTSRDEERFLELASYAKVFTQEVVQDGSNARTD
mgnify:CR=1 FL=1